MAKNKQSNFFLYFGLAWLVLGSPFLLMGRVMIDSEQRFEAEGVQVTGKITNKTITIPVKRGSRALSPRPARKTSAAATAEKSNIAIMG